MMNLKPNMTKKCRDTIEEDNPAGTGEIKPLSSGLFKWLASFLQVNHEQSQNDDIQN